MKVRTGEAGTLAALYVSEDPTLADAMVFTSVTDGEGCVSLNATGLDPSTLYHYGVGLRTSAPDPTKQGRFITHPPVGTPTSFTFGYSSCAGNRDLNLWPDTAMKVSNAPVFEQAREILVEDDEALFFCFNGDFHYSNFGPGNGFRYKAVYDAITLAPIRSKFHRDLPLSYMFDNHDSQQSGQSNSPYTWVAPEVDPIYRQRVPSYPVEPGKLWQEWQIGRVQFILTDERSHRTGPDGSMLGTEQKTWFFDILENSDSEFLVWLSPDNWSFANWDNFPTERAEIGAKLIAEGWADKMIFIGGHLHASGYLYGKFNPNGGFPEFIVSGMDSNGGSLGPWDVVETNFNYKASVHPPNGGFYMWGRFHVQDDGVNPITLTVDLMDEDQRWASCEVVNGATVPTYPPIAITRQKATALWRAKSYFSGIWADEMGNDFNLTIGGGATFNTDHFQTPGTGTTTPLLYSGTNPLTGGATPATLIIVTEVVETLNNGYDCLISVGGPEAGDNGLALFRQNSAGGHFPYIQVTNPDGTWITATHNTALTTDGQTHVLACGRTSDEIWVEMDGVRITTVIANVLKTNPGISIGTAYTAIHDIALKVFGAAIIDGYSLTSDEVADIGAYLQT